MIITSTDHADLQEQPEENATSDTDNYQKIAVVDGMVLVKKLSTKSAALVIVKNLSVCFNDRLHRSHETL